VASGVALLKAFKGKHTSVNANIVFACNHNIWEFVLATLWKMELQYYVKFTCNFLQKTLAKNKLLLAPERKH